jgi:hypothetical protein
MALRHRNALKIMEINQKWPPWLSETKRNQAEQRNKVGVRARNGSGLDGSRAAQAGKPVPPAHMQVWKAV